MVDQDVTVIIVNKLLFSLLNHNTRYYDENNHNINSSIDNQSINTLFCLTYRMFRVLCHIA